jgi:uncharacterized protein with PQ loop repeat
MSTCHAGAVTAVAVLGAMAVGSSLLFVWPQVVKLARTRDIDGISLPSTQWAMVGYLLWVAYGLPEGLPFVVLANAQAVVGFGAVVVLVNRQERVPRRVRQVAGIGLVVLVLVAIGAPSVVVGGLAILAGASGFVPQAIVALRDPDLSGLSIATYLLIALSTTVWAAYGVAEADPILVAPTVLILPCSLLIAGRIVLTGRGAAAATA